MSSAIEKFTVSKITLPRVAVTVPLAYHVKLRNTTSQRFKHIEKLKISVATNQINDVKANIPTAYPKVVPVISLIQIEAPIVPNKNGRQNHIVHFKKSYGLSFPQK